MGPKQNEAQKKLEVHKKSVELGKALDKVSIHDATEQELLKKLVMSQRMSESYLKSIDNNVKFFFYIIMISLVVSILIAVLTASR